MSDTQKWQNDITTITQYLQNKDWNKAEKALNRLESEHSDKAEVVYLRSLLLLKRGQDQEALRKLEECVSQFPDYSPALHNLSVLYWQSDQKDKAIEKARDAFEAAPENKQTAQNLLDMLIKKGQRHRASQFVSRMLVQHENQPDLIQLAATLHIDLGEPIKAKYYIDLGKKYTPNKGVWSQLENILGEKFEGAKKNQKKI
jgi:predicted Zn-dependent protease